MLTTISVGTTQNIKRNEKKSNELDDYLAQLYILLNLFPTCKSRKRFISNNYTTDIYPEIFLQL